MTFCLITTASNWITHLSCGFGMEEDLQAHLVQKLEPQFQMVRSSDQDGNHPQVQERCAQSGFYSHQVQAGRAQDSSHPRQTWEPVVGLSN